MTSRSSQETTSRSSEQRTSYDSSAHELTTPDQPALFGLSELTRRTGATKATIQHYLRLGLIPRPVVAGPRRFLYDSRHVRALELVKDMQATEGWSLSEISEAFTSLPGGLDSLLADDDPSGVVPIGQHPRLSLAMLVEERAKCSPRSRLLRAAACAFSRKGVSRVHVDEIAEMAGVAKGTFYLYFDSKEELFLEAALYVAREVASEVRAAGNAKRASSLQDASGVLAQALAPRAGLFLELLAMAAAGRTEEKETACRALAEIASACADAFPRAGRDAGDFQQLIGSALLRPLGLLESRGQASAMSATVAS